MNKKGKVGTNLVRGVLETYYKGNLLVIKELEIIRNNLLLDVAKNCDTFNEFSVKVAKLCSPDEMYEIWEEVCDKN